MPWAEIIWFGVLVLSCYAFILKALVRQWSDDPDMGHGFFVPLIAGYIIWQMRKELSATKLEPTWWGLAVVLWGAAQMFVGALTPFGSERAQRPGCRLLPANLRLSSC